MLRVRVLYRGTRGCHYSFVLSFFLLFQILCFALGFTFAPSTTFQKRELAEEAVRSGKVVLEVQPGSAPVPVVQQGNVQLYSDVRAPALPHLKRVSIDTQMCCSSTPTFVPVRFHT